MNVSLDCKDYVKYRYLGILTDSSLSWNVHIEYIALKISKTVGLVAKFTLCTSHTLLNIYQPLISPYITYRYLSVWGQAYKSLFLRTGQTFKDKTSLLTLNLFNGQT